jgi:hypothetical protein
MAKLKGISEFNTAIGRFKDQASELRSAYEAIKEVFDEKEDWLNNRTDKYQESDKGQEWSDHLGQVENTLSSVECILDDIDNIELIEE